VGYANDDGRPYSPVPEGKDTGAQPKQVLMAKAVLSELAQVFRNITFPPAGSGWSQGSFFFFEPFLFSRNSLRCA